MIKSQKDDHIKQLRAQIKELNMSKNVNSSETMTLIENKNVEIANLKEQISELKETIPTGQQNGLYEDKIEYYVL